MAHRLGYARVSTTAQDVALQLDALTAAGCARIWTDMASGARDDRVQLGLLLEAALPGDTVVVWRLDRLGRSLRHLIDVVVGLESRGVGFQSLTEAIDTTSAGGRLTFHIFGAMAEFERQLIRDRTVAGLDAARLRGRVGGRPTRMPPARVEQARRMRAEGHTMAEIAAVLGVGRTTVYRHLGDVPVGAGGGLPRATTSTPSTTAAVSSSSQSWPGSAPAGQSGRRR